MKGSSPMEKTMDSLSKLSLNNKNSCGLDIQMEFVSEEEMASLEAALAAATPSSLSSSATPATPSSSQFQRKARSIQSITSPPSKAKRRLSFSAEFDIEDLGSHRSAQKKNRVAESFFQRFRSKTGLYVSDVTSTEWCEKQMEFVHLFQVPNSNSAMRTGRARHAILEEEVVKKVKLQVRSVEDEWAVRLMNFIICAKQLLFEGLTRELPLIGFVEGVWMVGMIDEVRMPVTETDRNAILVETKTRVTDTPPPEPQQRKGRLQLMCYKYLWDNLVDGNFPYKQLFNFFSLNPYSILSEEIRENNTKSGFPAKTLDDVMRCFRHTCGMLPPADDQLLLRYEYQKDNTVLGEEHFPYDPDWAKSEIHRCLEFLMGEREGRCTPEGWKCRSCQFAEFCPTQTKPADGTPS